jgi:hypothetical protein
MIASIRCRLGRIGWILCMKRLVRFSVRALKRAVCAVSAMDISAWIG